MIKYTIKTYKELFDALGIAGSVNSNKEQDAASEDILGKKCCRESDMEYGQTSGRQRGSV
ncbi:hypothetical protein ARMGADRAFT_1021043 [Armillaria gallica]|uniref:Uncharacterized protein n=1 Tax=Armillaria gallica TaxID=47427 RepID=A0A2H3CG03_ARMGA|nr:hypothetical protein ARMGADRAFT_1021043 [Armillaria gallica]